MLSTSSGNAAIWCDGIERGERALEPLKEFTDEVILAVVHEFHLRQRHWQLVHIYARAAGVWPVLPWRPSLSPGVQHVVSGRAQMWRRAGGKGSRSLWDTAELIWATCRDAEEGPHFSAVAGNPKAAGRAVTEAIVTGAHIAAVVHALVLTPVLACAGL